MQTTPTRPAIRMFRATFIVFWFALGAINASAQVTGSRLKIPGTGVEIVPPPGLAQAVAGSQLIDETGETFITFVMSDPQYRLDTDPTWRQLFKKEPEKIEGLLSGNLLRRTRAADGGGWDGWVLTVVKGGKVLTVMAAYTGSSASYFQSIRDHLLTITWDETIVDPELALGVSTQPQGLKLVRGSFGALSYTVSGTPGGSGPTLMIQAMPVPANKAGAVFPSGCQPTIAAVFGSRKFSGPAMQENPFFSYCEGWSTEAGPEMQYFALARTKTGALLNILGSAPPATFAANLSAFRGAVAGLRLLPGRATRQ